MKRAEKKGDLKIPEGKGRPVVKIDSSTGKIIKRYKQLNEMARDIDTSNASAYYRIKSQRAVNGELFMYEEDWEKRFPMLAGKKESEPVPEEPAVRVAEPSADEASEHADKQTSKLQKMIDEQAQADERERAEMEAASADPVNHPSHYCTGDIECWDAMCSAFGPEWMKAYANIAAFKYNWRAKHKGNFAEDMRKAAWYNTRAAELEERLNG